MNPLRKTDLVAIEGGRDYVISHFDPQAANSHLDRLLPPPGDSWWIRWKQCFQPVEEYPGLLDTASPLGRSADIFGHLYPVRRTSFLFSFLLVGLLLLAVGATGLGGRYYVAESPAIMELAVTPLVVPPDLLPPKLRASRAHTGTSGGGARSPSPASRGKLPKAASEQFVPPAVNPPPDAQLVMAPTLIAQPMDIPELDFSMWGDPLAVAGPPSNGPGSGGGIGAGVGGGVGNGTGPGFPSTKKAGGIVAGGGVIPPHAVKRTPPQYTQQAYQANLEGKVVLQVLVLSDGTAQVLRVISGLPMGLTEQAIKAVQTWTFEAGRRNGQPIAMEAQITIFFRR